MRFRHPPSCPWVPMGLSKACCRETLSESGAEIIFGNTFTFGYVREQRQIRAHGDLHDFMGWEGPILTDSVGFRYS